MRRSVDEALNVQTVALVLARRSLQAHYQPIVDLRSQAVAGCEALARWTGPDGEAVPPSTFIPLAERHGLIADLGDRVLEKVLTHLAGWHRAGLPVVPVAVNFSAAQFRRVDMASRVAAALARHSLPAELIVWAAGVKAPDFLKGIGGLETNRINQLVVTGTLQTTAVNALPGGAAGLEDLVELMQAFDGIVEEFEQQQEGGEIARTNFP